MTQKYLDALELFKTDRFDEFIDVVRTKCLDVELPFARSSNITVPDPTLFDEVCKRPKSVSCIVALLPLVTSINAQQLARVYGKTSDAVSKRFMARFIELNGGKFPATGKVFCSTELVKCKADPWTTVTIWHALRHYDWSYKLARTCVEAYGMPPDLVVPIRTFRRGASVHSEAVIALAGANPAASLADQQLSAYLLSTYTSEALGVTSDEALKALARWRHCDSLCANMCSGSSVAHKLYRARIECIFWELIEASEGNPALPGTLADLLEHAAGAMNTDACSDQYSGALFIARMAITAGASVKHIKEELRGWLPVDLRVASDQLYGEEKQCDKCHGKGTLPRTFSELGAAAKRARIEKANQVLEEEFGLSDESTE